MKVYLNNNNTNFEQMCIKFEIFKQKIRKYFKVFNEEQSAKKNNLIFNTKNINRKIRRTILKTNKLN